MSDNARGYAMNAPALIAILLLVAYPIGYSFWVSLHRDNLAQPAARKLIGLDNYLSLVDDPAFLASLRVSALFVLVVVGVTVVMGLVLALVLNETFMGRGVLRSLVLLPWAMPGVVNGLMWRTVFDAKTGALNGLLTDLGLIDSYQAWLASDTGAFFFTAFAQVWNTLPFAVIILLAGLSTIPGELYDAAKVDRAGVFQRFRQVTLPWLLHPLLIVLILETMNAFRAFDTIYVLTGGGPGDATTTVALLSVQRVLTYTDVGLGSAYAWVITLITLIISVAYVGLLYRRGVSRYDDSSPPVPDSVEEDRGLRGGRALRVVPRPAVLLDRRDELHARSRRELGASTVDSRASDIGELWRLR
ncbi:sugar ABC transporter permease [Kibdelosporangium philippinense]|uniref:Sugar ABC transporter permease n=1 Tax=Kibdelosporangium philippinense TaxID=211113 RepID=A0ABS8ZU35_9PSEU|nr:sugar ABC transporter permease [Kibdelosporangium philippinense]MCE7011250.1 sugar ABC transporter permease [Kibdelosporangium philippinense]